MTRFLCILLYETLFYLATVESGQQLLANDIQTSSAGVDCRTHLFHDSLAEQLITSYGYPCESHKIITEDGYILTVHRIRGGRNSSQTEYPLPVVLVHHGFLAASDTWLFRGPSRDLPYILADAGFDVWICNARGNVNSRRHLILDPDKDHAFWNFSVHEFGVYDLPATIDYILNATNQSSIFFIGHSLGAAAFFIMCSIKPEYNTKITMMSALAPAATIVHPPPPAIKMYNQLIKPLTKILKKYNMYEMFPQGHFMTKIGEQFCHEKAITQPICLAVMFFTVGSDSEQFDKAMFAQALKYYPAGTSIGVLEHVGLIFAGHFGLSDDNTRYNLTKVTAPVSLHFGEGDLIINKTDIEALAANLSNVVGIFPVPYKQFNHVDFMWGKDSKHLLYDYLIRLMNTYSHSRLQIELPTYVTSTPQSNFDY